MSSFDRYIFRNVFGAFLLILISLTAVIWLTHALREIDLMTNQRQTVLTFIGITGLLRRSHWWSRSGTRSIGSIRTRRSWS
jgi:lipopolysaccharide export system permease protein